MPQKGKGHSTLKIIYETLIYYYYYFIATPYLLLLYLQLLISTLLLILLDYILMTFTLLRIKLVSSIPSYLLFSRSYRQQYKAIHDGMRSGAESASSSPCGNCTQSSEHSRQAQPQPKSFSFRMLETEPRALHSRPGFYH